MRWGLNRGSEPLPTDRTARWPTAREPEIEAKCESRSLQSLLVSAACEEPAATQVKWGFAEKRDIRLSPFAKSDKALGFKTEKALDTWRVARQVEQLRRRGHCARAHRTVEPDDRVNVALHRLFIGF